MMKYLLFGSNILYKSMLGLSRSTFFNVSYLFKLIFLEVKNKEVSYLFNLIFLYVFATDGASN